MNYSKEKKINYHYYGLYYFIQFFLKKLNFTQEKNKKKPNLNSNKQFAIT